MSYYIKFFLKNYPEAMLTLDMKLFKILWALVLSFLKKCLENKKNWGLTLAGFILSDTQPVIQKQSNFNHMQFFCARVEHEVGIKNLKMLYT